MPLKSDDMTKEENRYTDFLPTYKYTGALYRNQTIIPVYNMLYSDIVNGICQSGTVLPSESSMTKKYGVSRNTLRQALTIFNEDNIIEKLQGKGTNVTNKENYLSLEKRIDIWTCRFFNTQIFSRYPT